MSREDFYKDWMVGVCAQCSKRKTCRTPCKPVELYTAGPGGTFYEQGNQVFPEGNTEREYLPPAGGSKSCNIDVAWGWTDDEDLVSSLAKTNAKVFYLRFFEGWSYKDIATSVDLSDEHSAQSTYRQAVNKLMAALELIERKGHLHQRLKGGEDLPEGLRAYLARAIFDLSYDDLVDVLGCKSHTGSALKIKASKAIRKLNGREISLAEGVFLRVEKKG